MDGRENPGNGPGGNAVEIRVAARLDNLALLRTVAAAIGAYERLDDVGVADLRLAVDEACTYLISLAVPNAPLMVVIDPTDVDLAVEVSVPGIDDHALSSGSFSWYVLNSLAEQVEPFHGGHDPADPDWLIGIRLTTRRAG